MCVTQIRSPSLHQCKLKATPLERAWDNLMGPIDFYHQIQRNLKLLSKSPKLMGQRWSEKCNCNAPSRAAADYFLTLFINLLILASNQWVVKCINACLTEFMVRSSNTFCFFMSNDPKAINLQVYETSANSHIWKAGTIKCFFKNYLNY